MIGLYSARDRSHLAACRTVYWYTNPATRLVGAEHPGRYTVYCPGVIEGSSLGCAVKGKIHVNPVVQYVDRPIPSAIVGDPCSPHLVPGTFISTRPFQKLGIPDELVPFANVSPEDWTVADQDAVRRLVECIDKDGFNRQLYDRPSAAHRNWKLGKSSSSNTSTVILKLLPSLFDGYSILKDHEASWLARIGGAFAADDAVEEWPVAAAFCGAVIFPPAEFRALAVSTDVADQRRWMRVLLSYWLLANGRVIVRDATDATVVGMPDEAAVMYMDEVRKFNRADWRAYATRYAYGVDTDALDPPDVRKWVFGVACNECFSTFYSLVLDIARAPRASERACRRFISSLGDDERAGHLHLNSALWDAVSTHLVDLDTADIMLYLPRKVSRYATRKKYPIFTAQAIKGSSGPCAPERVRRQRKSQMRIRVVGFRGDSLLRPLSVTDPWLCLDATVLFYSRVGIGKAFTHQAPPFQTLGVGGVHPLRLERWLKDRVVRYGASDGVSHLLARVPDDGRPWPVVPEVLCGSLESIALWMFHAQLSRSRQFDDWAIFGAALTASARVLLRGFATTSAWQAVNPYVKGVVAFLWGALASACKDACAVSAGDPWTHMLRGARPSMADSDVAVCADVLRSIMPSPDDVTVRNAATLPEYVFRYITYALFASPRAIECAAAIVREVSTLGSLMDDEEVAAILAVQRSLYDGRAAEMGDTEVEVLGDMANFVDALVLRACISYYPVDVHEAVRPSTLPAKVRGGTKRAYADGTLLTRSDARRRLHERFKSTVEACQSMADHLGVTFDSCTILSDPAFNVDHMPLVLPEGSVEQFIADDEEPTVVDTAPVITQPWELVEPLGTEWWSA